MKEAIITADVSTLLSSITGNHCHSVGGRLVAKPFLRRGEREGEDSRLHHPKALTGHLRG